MERSIDMVMYLFSYCAQMSMLLFCEACRALENTCMKTATRHWRNKYQVYISYTAYIKKARVNDKETKTNVVRVFIMTLIMYASRPFLLDRLLATYRFLLHIY